ncbi:MAG: toxin-antitoxin system HicB family antitoxin [Candidatus Eremiobacteraeota bacterium]|nr:toxin-antitoxin system HicB family antitoxin [Candidatus Eremiobacteraeota bacterium]
MSYKLFDYNIKVFQDKRDGDFGACIEEIPEVSAYGETVNDAVNELKTVYNLWLEDCQELCYPIPEPFNVRDFSGKFVLRMPKSLHKSLAVKAKKEGISLNQETIYCINKGLVA